MKRSGFILILVMLAGFAITGIGQDGEQELILEQGVNEYEGVRDTTIFSEGGLSNGGGDHVFTGLTNQDALRRTLIAFDLSEIPEGATIASAVLTFRVSQVQVNARDATINAHRLSSDWGEGTVDAAGQEGRGATSRDGDATWDDNFQGESSWETPGGDFDSEASGTGVAGNAGSVLTIAGEGLAADVQSWIDNPDGNFGWILVSDGQARRYNSSNNENVDEGLHPRLTITFTTSSL